MLWHVSTSLKQFAALNGYCCHSLSSLWTVGLHLRNASTGINMYCSKICTDDYFTTLSGVTAMRYSAHSGMIRSFKSQCGKTWHKSETFLKSDKRMNIFRIWKYYWSRLMWSKSVPRLNSHFLFLFCFQPYRLIHTDPCRSAGTGEK